MLKVCYVVLLPVLNLACSSAIIYSAWGLNLLGFKLIAANLQHDFAPLTNEADGSVVRQSCRIPFFEC